MNKLPVLLLALAVLAFLVLSCDGAGIATNLSASPTSSNPDWPIQRHPSMAEWDAAYAAWREEWQAAPTAPPLDPDPLSAEEALTLAGQAMEHFPPTPLPQPFQTPARVALPPFHEDPFLATIAQGEQGIRTIFRPDNRLTDGTHWLHPGETFGGLLFFGHYIYPPPAELAQGSDFRLLCLQDFRQIPFRLDGSEGLVHDFHMGPNEERAFRLEFPGISPGVHSLICLYYTNPDAVPLSNDLPAYDAWSSLWKANGAPISDLLFVGEEGLPAISYALLSGSLPADPNLHDALMVNASALEEDAWRDWMPSVWEDDQLIEWGPVQAAPGEEMAPVLRASNPAEVPFRFGVTAFLDYQQVPLRVGEANPVSWYELPPGTQGVIPLSFVVPETPGNHVYFIVAFQTPYEPTAVYEWAGDTVQFPWVAIAAPGGTQVMPVPNLRRQQTVNPSFDRIPLLVGSE